MHQNEKYFEDFPKADKKDWENAAREELQGADPWQKLSSSLFGLDVLPYYDATAAANAAPLLRNAEDSFLGPRTWYNCPHVAVNNEADANKTALRHLASGADGILFSISSTPDLPSLLKNIDLGSCSISFLASGHAHEFINSIDQYYSTSSEMETALPGAFFGNIVSERVNSRSLHGAGLQVSHSGSAENDLVSVFTSLLKPQVISGSVKSALMIPLTTQFFGDIVILRAARMIWNMISQHAGSADPGSLFILGHSAAWTNPSYASHENMLKSTMAAMGGILGGCDALTIEPQDAGNELTSRVARNISNVLREESHLSKVADPLAGSWFIESACAQLTEKVWARIKPLLS